MVPNGLRPIGLSTSISRIKSCRGRWFPGNSVSHKGGMDPNGGTGPLKRYRPGISNRIQRWNLSCIGPGDPRTGMKSCTLFQGGPPVNYIDMERPLFFLHGFSTCWYILVICFIMFPSHPHSSIVWCSYAPEESGGFTLVGRWTHRPEPSEGFQPSLVKMRKAQRQSTFGLFGNIL